MTLIALNIDVLIISEMRIDETFSYFSSTCHLDRDPSILEVVLFHDTRSNDSLSNDVQFMHKLCLSLRVMTRLMREE